MKPKLTAGTPAIPSHAYILRPAIAGPSVTTNMMVPCSQHGFILSYTSHMYLDVTLGLVSGLQLCYGPHDVRYFGGELDDGRTLESAGNVDRGQMLVPFKIEKQTDRSG